MRRPRSPDEQRLLEAAARLVPAGVRSPSASAAHAMVVRAARGARLWDWSGNEYVDYLLGSGPMLLGHAHPAVVAAAQEQLARGSGYLLINEPAIRLAEQIVELVPCAEAVSLHSTGSEPAFFALRLARAYRKRDVILKFEGGYHGMSDYALMSTQWTRQVQPYPTPFANSAGIPRALAELVLVAPFNDVATTSAIIERHHDVLAAVIVEPLMRTVPPQPGFLAELRRITLHYDIPLVFDEVVTGFRLALGGAQERYGVTPDLCALGKAISAGHPLGILCGRRDLMALADPERRFAGDGVLLSGTYSGNPVSAAVALACIAELRKPGVYERLAATGRRLMSELQRLLDEARIPARVSGEPSVFQPWFTDREIVDFRSTLTSAARLEHAFVERLLECGVLKAHEKFFLSTAHTDEDVALTLDAFATAVEGLRGGA